MNPFLSVALVTLFFASIALGGEPVRLQYPGKIEIRNFEAGKPYLTNRKYLLKKVPPALSGMKFTALPGNALKDFQANIAKGSVVYLALDDGKKSPANAALHEYANALDRTGWKYFDRILVSDERMETLRVLVKTFREDETVEFKGLGFVGSIVIAPEIKLERQ